MNSDLTFPDKVAISFVTQNISFRLTERKKIISLLKLLISEHKKKTGNLCFVFTNDENLLQINKQYLHHDYYTDIITFNYCEKDIISGDIMISVDRVIENARKFNANKNEELKRVIIHGVLHLIGYDDNNPKNIKKMRTTENEWLQKYTNI
ncbi:MAG: rRNA maturation RNase YbeY [Bacteroidota bacterium]